LNTQRPVLVVTGASRGIGAATARLAARRGHAVCVNYRAAREEAEALAAEIRAGGGDAIAVQADISDERQVEALFEAADRMGPLDGLVNNAGVLERQCALADMEAARIARIMATNVVGLMLCAREAVRRLSTHRGGRGGAIVNVSSAAARTGSPGEYVDYAASKGAVDTFTRGLAVEVAAQGIRVNAVRPGFIHTGIHARGGEPARIERLAPSIPLGRGGTPEEVAQAIVWLLSSDASYSTGIALDVSGGR
jgi:NAD(P)-dependent dehydrogenase (short-subunit alcohol dehydrogenase family)